MIVLIKTNALSVDYVIPFIVFMVFLYKVETLYNFNQIFKKYNFHEFDLI
jgi:hypothetical protein